MKKLLSLVAAGILLVGIANAQERGSRQNRSPEELAKMQVERLTTHLSLDKNQQDSIYKYALIAGKEQRQLMEAAGDNREAALEKIRSKRADNEKIIKSFLTDDQQKIYEEFTKNRPHRGQQNRN